MGMVNYFISLENWHIKGNGNKTSLWEKGFFIMKIQNLYRALSIIVTLMSLINFGQSMKVL